MTDAEQMALDRELLGVSFAVEREDGTLERVDPDDVERDASGRWIRRGRLETVRFRLESA